MTNFQELLKKLNAKPITSQWYEAKCPFHDDHNPSLEITEEGFQCMACGAKGTLEELEEKLMT